MDSSHDNMQKDFLSSLFPPESQSNQLEQGADGPQHLMYNGSTNQAPMRASSSNGPKDSVTQMNLELLGSLMSMQNVEVQQALSQQAPYSPHMLLEQQFKLTQLQQLQQLQNQIFQQQIALISGQTPVSNLPSAESSTEGRRTEQQQQQQQQQQYNGLPTPGSSSELRPQTNTDFVSPMILQYLDTPQAPYEHNSMDTMTPQQPPVHQQFNHSHGSSSAPAHIAFDMSPIPVNSTNDLDFDISPLTSPWLEPHNQTFAQRQATNKRTASSSGDEMPSRPARKKPSPAIKPTIPPAPKKIARGTKSANSTPLIRSSRSRRGSVVTDVPGDTPSPVDLSMPPPAPPPSTGPPPPTSMSMQASTSTLSIEGNSHLTPVTPASIMKLGRLGLNGGGLAPQQGQKDVNQMFNTVKGKAPLRPKVSTDAATRNRGPKKSPGFASATSPGLKPILPAGNASVLPGPSIPASQNVPGRKTSHKDAEQKRRDSLKTTFDELRMLLPPIPLPSDEHFPDERILPGALPPRGPPKAGGEGPNKGVSKLQLLMCGNDYIRQLKGKVERRDEEIKKLRREIIRLRGFVGEDAMNVSGEDIDLERDLDASEGLSSCFGLASASSFGSHSAAMSAIDDEVEEG